MSLLSSVQPGAAPPLGRWRALALVVKAKLEAVESGIASFEQEFMANTLLSDGRTVAQFMEPQIVANYESGRMPELLPGLPPETRLLLERGR